MISGGLINIIIAYGLFVVVVETKSSAPGGPPGWYRQSPPPPPPPPSLAGLMTSLGSAGGVSVVGKAVVRLTLCAASQSFSLPIHWEFDHAEFDLGLVI